MLLETVLSTTKTTIETAHIQIVETLGVRWRGWILANIFGSAPWLAIESVARVVGRIVVCVEADAEVSTAMISSLSHGEPSTSLPRAPSTSSELSFR